MKNEILRHSAINLNRFLAVEDDWDESRIIARGEQLFRASTSGVSYG